jgi:hypothetical protein
MLAGGSAGPQSAASAVDIHPPSAILFSEGSETWRPLPSWVRWFLDFGYRWTIQQGKRRICILSTPCDSPAAALVALGLMRRRLEVPDAGDLASHLGHLRSLYAKGKTDTILRRVNSKKRFRLANADADGTLWAHIAGSTSVRYKIVEEFAYDWHVDGEPPVQVSRGAPLMLSDTLQSLFHDADPALKENLARTDSAICLAGRVAGGSQTQESLSTIRFRSGDSVSSLGSLLTVHGWHDGRVSRVSFYNSRSREFDRAARLPMVVSVEGAAASGRVLADQRFTESDVIAVIPRTSELEQLDTAAQQLTSLSQWYTPEDVGRANIERAPKGVVALVLRKD